MSNEIIGAQTPRSLTNGQVIIEVSGTNDQYLTEYIKYTATDLRSFNLDQAEEFKSFIFDPRLTDYQDQDASRIVKAADWDNIIRTENATSDVWAYYRDGALIRTTTLNFADASKKNLISVVRT